MKIKKLKLTNFRGYQKQTEVSFNNLTVFVGRNDVGKSTILEALDLFFNDGKGVVKYDKSDLNIPGNPDNTQEFEIEATFTELPDEIVLDATYRTKLSEEYLLNQEGELEVVKKFNGAKCKGTFIRAFYPNRPECADLHRKKARELKGILSSQHIECENQSVNALMRKAIWKRYSDDLQLATTDIDVAGGEEAKQIWGKLSAFLPVYSLFQSDRQNTDGDKEIQDPLKAAVAVFLQEAELQETLRDIAEQVEEKLRDVAGRTLAKLREMDPNAANSLNPQIPSAESLKWADVFRNVSITADDNIPINKRGSGIKRLILLNFFRAEAERRQEEQQTGIIYAIEEPETSQHFENQKILAEALIALSEAKNTQVIFTTHSGVIVKKLRYDDIRLISVNEDGSKRISSIKSGLLGYPSMNEVNYTAFGEVTEEYHDELYGYIESNNLMAAYKNGKTERPYVRVLRGGGIRRETRTLTGYIRDVMHHPENTHNAKYTDAELRHSIEDMRAFISAQNASSGA